MFIMFIKLQKKSCKDGYKVLYSVMGCAVLETRFIFQLKGQIFWCFQEVFCQNPMWEIQKYIPS